MGFYLRKSVRVGHLRFNFSKSGIGVSSGFKGFRVSSGPRGNYVYMGAHGIYYRTTLSSRSRAHPPVQPMTPLPAQPSRQDEPVAYTNLTPIESGSVLEMVDSSSTELLAEIQAKRRKLRLWPLAVTLTLLGCIGALASSFPAWALIVILLVGGGLTGLAAYRDDLRKSVVIFYDLGDDTTAPFQGLHVGFDWLASCGRIWHLEAQGRTTDWKRSAGATGVVKRRAIILQKGGAPHIKTNVAVPTIPAGKQTLYFFPDRLLVFEGGNVGAVDYSVLQIDAGTTKFVEDESVPADATVLEYRWKYINKKGGPDRRFKNNRQLPVALYGELYLRSASGLNEAFHLSKSEAPQYFATGISNTAKALSLNQAPPPVPPLPST